MQKCDYPIQARIQIVKLPNPPYPLDVNPITQIEISIVCTERLVCILYVAKSFMQFDQGGSLIIIVHQDKNAVVIRTQNKTQFYSPLHELLISTKQLTNGLRYHKLYTYALKKLSMCSTC